MDTYGRTLAHLKHSFEMTCNRRQHYPSDRHQESLTALLRTFAKMIHGELPPKGFVSALAPGLGKSTALISSINYVTSNPDLKDLGVLVCINTHDEIEAFCNELDDLSKVFVWIDKNSHDRVKKFCGAGSSRKAQVLITTHERIRREMGSWTGSLKDFGSTSSLYFKGKPREFRCWDESFLLAAPICLEAQTLFSIAGHLDTYDQPSAETIRGIAKSILGLDIKAEQSVQWNVPEFSSISQRHYKQHLRDVRPKLSPSMIDTFVGTLSAVLSLRGETVAVRRVSIDSGSGKDAVVSFNPTIPTSLFPLVVLDASAAPGVRQTYKPMMDNGHLEMIEPYHGKSFEKFDLTAINRGGGKDAIRRHLKSILQDVCKWIIAEVPSGEPLLVLTHKPEDPEQVRRAILQRTGKSVPPDAVEFIPEMVSALQTEMAELHPDYDSSKWSACYYGEHRGQNHWRDFEYAAAIGVLVKSTPVYEATLRAASQVAPAELLFDKEAILEFRKGEILDDLLQGLGRICIRKVDPVDRDCAPFAKACVVASFRTIDSHRISGAFPDCKFSIVYPESRPVSDVTTNAIEHLRHFAESVESGQRLTRVHLRQLLGAGDTALPSAIFNKRVLSSKRVADNARAFGLREYSLPGKRKCEGWEKI